MLIDEAWAKVPEADRERVRAIGYQWERINRMTKTALVAREIARSTDKIEKTTSWHTATDLKCAACSNVFEQRLQVGEHPFCLKCGSRDIVNAQPARQET